MSRATLLLSIRAAIATMAVVAAGTAPADAVADEQAFTRTPGSPDLACGPCPAFMPDGCRIAVLHGDPARPAADLFFKLPAGQSVPAHWHTSAERMVLVSGEMRVTYDGQPPVTLTAGSYAYGPPEREHDATCISGQDCVLFIAFEEPVDAFPSAEQR